MTSELAEAILSSAPDIADGQDVTDLLAYRTTTGWLLIDGMTDLLTLRQLDRYLTTRGDVYRVNSVGHFDRGGPIARVEAVTVDSPNTVLGIGQTDASGNFSLEVDNNA